MHNTLASGPRKDENSSVVLPALKHFSAFNMKQISFVGKEVTENMSKYGSNRGISLPSVTEVHMQTRTSCRKISEAHDALLNSTADRS